MKGNKGPTPPHPNGKQGPTPPCMNGNKGPTPPAMNELKLFGVAFLESLKKPKIKGNELL